MEPFQYYIICSKCYNDNHMNGFSIEYKRGNLDAGCHDTAKEHLHVKCNKCGFVFPMRTAET